MVKVKQKRKGKLLLEQANMKAWNLTEFPLRIEMIWTKGKILIYIYEDKDVPEK